MRVGNKIKGWQRKIDPSKKWCSPLKNKLGKHSLVPGFPTLFKKDGHKKNNQKFNHLKEGSFICFQIIEVFIKALF